MSRENLTVMMIALTKSYKKMREQAKKLSRKSIFQAEGTESTEATKQQPGGIV